MVADAQFCFHLGQSRFNLSVCEGSSQPPSSSQKGQGSCVQHRIWGAPSLLLGSHRLLVRMQIDCARKLALTVVCYSWVWGPWWDVVPQSMVPRYPHGAHIHLILQRCQSARLEATITFFVSRSRRLSLRCLTFLLVKNTAPDCPHSVLCSTFHIV